MYRKIPQRIGNRGYTLGKVWRKPEILRAEDFSLPDMNFSGNGITSCQVSMLDSCGARPGMDSCGARRRKRLLAILARRSAAFQRSGGGEEDVSSEEKSERRGQEKFSAPPPDFRLFDVMLQTEDSRKGHGFRTGRTLSLSVPGLHDLVISPDMPRSSPYPFP